MLWSRFPHSLNAAEALLCAGSGFAACSGSNVNLDPTGAADAALPIVGACGTGAGVALAGADTLAAVGTSEANASDLQQVLQVTSAVFEVALALVAARPQAVFSVLMV